MKTLDGGFMFKICVLYFQVIFAVFFIFATTANAQSEASSDIDITALRQDIVELLHPYQVGDSKILFVPLEKRMSSAENEQALAELITEDVISDYLKILQFMSARAIKMEALREVATPELRAFADIKNNKVKHLILHQNAPTQEPIEYTTPDGQKKTWFRFCGNGCNKVMIDGYAEKITYVSYDRQTGEIIPNQIVSYERIETCDTYSFGLPQLGLCFEQKIADRPLEALKADGLHVYDKIGSPFWPKGFSLDQVPNPIPNSKQVTFSPPPAFKKLEHVKVTNRTQHRAFGVKRPGQAEVRFLDYDLVCVRITPKLPADAMKLLRDALPGEDKYKKLCHGGQGKTSTKDFLREWNVNGGDFDYASLLTPEEIERSLTRYYASNDSRSVLNTISKLKDLHPDFQRDIGHRLAPIVIDMAKKTPLDRHNKNNSLYKLLTAMPHESMSPYVEDLFDIVRRETDAIGCIDLNCREADPKKRSVLWKLAQIFNGGGAEAAPFLDKILAANAEAAGAQSAGWKPIGGLRNAASCIGQMSPKMEEILKVRYHGGQTSDYRFDFHWAQALRMSSQSEKAHQYIKDQYARMLEKRDDGTLQPNWWKTKNLEQSIELTKKILEDWDDQTPYCPSRDSPHTTW